MKQSKIKKMNAKNWLDVLNRINENNAPVLHKVVKEILNDRSIR